MPEPKPHSRVFAALHYFDDPGAVFDGNLTNGDVAKAREGKAALAVLVEQVRSARAEGYDEGQADIWDGAVCSACGRNHDRDESAMCESGEVVTFAEWAESARGLIEQFDALRSAAEAVMDEWSREFAEYGHPEDGDIPRWQTHPYSKLRDALASNPASGSDS